MSADDLEARALGVVCVLGFVFRHEGVIPDAIARVPSPLTPLQYLVCRDALGPIPYVIELCFHVLAFEVVEGTELTNDAIHTIFLVGFGHHIVCILARPSKPVQRSVHHRRRARPAIRTVIEATHLHHAVLPLSSGIVIDGLVTELCEHKVPIVHPDRHVSGHAPSFGSTHRILLCRLLLQNHRLRCLSACLLSVASDARIEETTDLIRKVRGRIMAEHLVCLPVPSFNLDSARYRDDILSRPLLEELLPEFRIDEGVLFGMPGAKVCS